MQGVTPKKLALSVALGVSIGLLPVFSLPTVLSFLCASLFRLNIAAIQLINYAVYPFWIALYIPYLTAGNILFDVPPIDLTMEEIELLLKEDFSKAIHLMGMAHLRAMLVWIATAPIIGLSTYYFTLPIFTKYTLKKIGAQ